MRLTLWPRSLASRTILILLAGFALIQLLGLLLHTFNQINLERIEEERDLATRAVIIYRHISLAAPADRPALVAREALPNGDTLTLDSTPPLHAGDFELPLAARQIIRASIFTYGIPAGFHPHGLILRVSLLPPRDIISFGMPDGAFCRSPARCCHRIGTFLDRAPAAARNAGLPPACCRHNPGSP